MCQGIHGISFGLLITRPLIVTPFATAASRIADGSTPLVFVPSPETSITWREAPCGLRLRRPIAYSIATPSEVRFANGRGASTICAANFPADTASWITVQSTMTCCENSPDHSK